MALLHSETKILVYATSFFFLSGAFSLGMHTSLTWNVIRREYCMMHRMLLLE